MGSVYPKGSPQAEIRARYRMALRQALAEASRCLDEAEWLGDGDVALLQNGYDRMAEAFEIAGEEAEYMGLDTFGDVEERYKAWLDGGEEPRAARAGAN